MEVIEGLAGDRITFVYILLFLLFIGVFIIFVGYKNLKSNKTVGILSILLGIIFSAVILYCMLITVFLGYNS